MTLRVGLLLPFFLVLSCMDSYDSKYVNVKNQSSNSIYFIISKRDIMFDYEKFLINERLKKGEEMSHIDVAELFVYEEHKTNTIQEYKGPMDWKMYLKNVKDKKVRFYIVEKDSVDKYGWKYINDNTVYNKKYLLTLKDLKNMNWEIIYE